MAHFFSWRVALNPSGVSYKKPTPEGCRATLREIIRLLLYTYLIAQNMKRFKADPNLLIAIGVLLANFVAIYIYMDQARIMQKQTDLLLIQAKGGAWPNLSLQMKLVGQNEWISNYEILIPNRGTGPAIVDQTMISYKGKAVTNWVSLFNEMNLPDSLMYNYSYYNIYDKVIRQDEDFTPDKD